MENKDMKTSRIYDAPYMKEAFRIVHKRKKLKQTFKDCICMITQNVNTDNRMRAAQGVSISELLAKHKK